ncbi:MAG: preprotein translocase subunit SecE [Pirellulales bacterium]|nr:preprotein translocase subunit SecE [Pirellulales bacterium]
MAGFLRELFRFGFYKRSQGRITRQVSGVALLIVFALGCWRLNDLMLASYGHSAAYGIAYWLPGLLLLIGGWFSYRLVNVSSVAGFLIAVEAEMNKVSWPTRSELFRASLVVLVCIIAMAVFLYCSDLVLSTLIQKVILR